LMNGIKIILKRVKYNIKNIFGLRANFYYI
jgi:hypothetical protein